MTPDDGGTNGEGQGMVELERCTTITIVFNHATSTVSLGMREVNIGLAQMILDEAVRQLDILRRQAAGQELMKQAMSAQQTAAVLEDLRKRR